MSTATRQCRAATDVLLELRHSVIGKVMSKKLSDPPAAHREACC